MKGWKDTEMALVIPEKHLTKHFKGMLNPRVQPREGNLEVTGIPQVDYSTSQRQLTSAQAEVAYLIKYPITTKPVVRTN